MILENPGVPLKHGSRNYALKYPRFLPASRHCAEPRSRHPSTWGTKMRLRNRGTYHPTNGRIGNVRGGGESGNLDHGRMSEEHPYACYRKRGGRSSQETSSTDSTAHWVDWEAVRFRRPNANKTNSPREQQGYLLKTFLLVRNPTHRLQEMPGTGTHSEEIKMPTRILLGLLKWHFHTQNVRIFGGGAEVGGGVPSYTYRNQFHHFIHVQSSSQGISDSSVGIATGLRDDDWKPGLDFRQGLRRPDHEATPPIYHTLHGVVPNYAREKFNFSVYNNKHSQRTKSRSYAWDKILYTEQLSLYLIKHFAMNTHLV
jgi:hypothetical protein